MSGYQPRGGILPGQKWVDLNHEAKENAKAQNGGVLPYSPALVTTEFPHCYEWSEENLPEILFYLVLPPSKYTDIKVPFLEENGKIVLNDERKPIRAFEVLPRHISLDVEGWLIEAWRRIDPRIKYQDILDRQQADPGFGGIGLKKLTKNALQNHCRRSCRKILNSWVEYGRRAEPHRTEVEAIERLSLQNIVLNTVLSVCDIASDRLVKLQLERHREKGLYHVKPATVTLQNIFNTTFPTDYFILPMGGNIKKNEPRMSPGMMAAWEMSLILSERAEIHGKSHWSKLDKRCLPVTWFDRTKDKATKNNTYDGGCPGCTWVLGRDQVSSNGSPIVKKSPKPAKPTKKRVLSSKIVSETNRNSNSARKECDLIAQWDDGFVPSTWPVEVQNSSENGELILYKFLEPDETDSSDDGVGSETTVAESSLCAHPGYTQLQVLNEDLTYGEGELVEIPDSQQSINPQIATHRQSEQVNPFGYAQGFGNYHSQAQDFDHVGAWQDATAAATVFNTGRYSMLTAANYADYQDQDVHYIPVPDGDTSEVLPGYVWAVDCDRHSLTREPSQQMGALPSTQVSNGAALYHPRPINSATTQRFISRSSPPPRGASPVQQPANRRNSFNDAFHLNSAVYPGSMESASNAVRNSAETLSYTDLLIEGFPYADLGATYAEVGATYVEMGAPYAELGAPYAELGATYAELGSTYAEMGAPYAELGAQYADLGVNGGYVQDTGADLFDAYRLQTPPFMDVD